ncbi:renalase isoform X2 [Brachyhypopomus gauderio]|uniref:renalase isoform X2 n=1 Tax=Brachyhypopomus gauderio TaxID=698409 RepID=UPI004043312D
MSRVLIVGSGLTGSICACLLHRQLFNKVKISVWDKASGAGGRMSTSQSPSNRSCTVDLGAQYITATPYYAKVHKSFYDELLLCGILKPLEATIEGMLSNAKGSINYVTPSGVSSIVKHYLNESGAEVLFGCRVTHVRLKGPGWEVCRQGASPEEFDVVVLTMPIPQILQLQGDVRSMMSEAERQMLEDVSYSSRFALGLFYKAGVRITIPWAAKYVSDNPRIRYIAIDDKKRNLGDGTGARPAGPHDAELRAPAGVWRRWLHTLRFRRLCGVCPEDLRGSEDLALKFGGWGFGRLERAPPTSKQRTQECLIWGRADAFELQNLLQRLL